ncbi:dihydrolipoamide acetyltransferase family protein [Acetomicrobium sp. S15 = DSM 107314]|uniref:dihydrolipoamide acetyltransferase family protein n=1 Tax=Acetomicrobium sp. S15 = DSM 107314 TaxID=2529858 RepID=UPI0018E1C528|nr:dihydrolipoamide acetyltransferase family protein [Acetomicrobium sp. S15 = DSM 107314]
MATVVTMPKLGLTMTEGSVSKWHKKEGERVEKGEIIAEVSTDKINYELEAPESGILRKILIEPDAKVPVTAPIAIIAEVDEDISSLMPKGTAEAAPATRVEAKAPPAPVAAQTPATQVIKASPAAKKLAKDHGIDLSLVTGTGPGGRIVEKDVEDYIERQKIEAAKPVAGPKETLPAAPAKRIPLVGMRKVIAQRMSESWHTSPMVTLNSEADASGLKSLREELKDEFKKRGASLSYNHILLKICAQALVEFPMLNTRLEGDEVILQDEVNIGLAIALEDGLIVPAVKNVDKKGLFRVAVETEELIERARGQRLTPDDISGGTFTITNLGMFDVRDFTPIINPPQCAILGVGAMTDRPVAIDGEVVIRPIMVLSLTFDHRIVDGAQGAQFLKRIKELVQNPLLLLS